jgi:dTDP-4-amino-4,6-dideoxygalactose transaminase
MWYRHNFGHDGPEAYLGLGINAKMSELQTAMGLSVLPYMEHIISERKRVCEYYNEYVNFDNLQKLKLREGTSWNFAYYPIVFESESQLLVTMQKLAVHSIHPRRYFYPSLEDLPYVNSKQCPITDDIARRILCLPLYTTLLNQDLNKIVITLNNG